MGVGSGKFRIKPEELSNIRIKRPMVTTQNLKQTFQSTRFSAGHLFINQLLDNNISGIRRLPACFATFDFAKMHLISVNYSCIDVLKRDLCNSILSWLLGRLGGVRGSNRHGSWSSLTFALLGFASHVACKVEIYIFHFESIFQIMRILWGNRIVFALTNVTFCDTTFTW